VRGELTWGIFMLIVEVVPLCRKMKTEKKTIMMLTSNGVKQIENIGVRRRTAFEGVSEAQRRH